MKQEGRGGGPDGVLSPGIGRREAVKKGDLSEQRKRLVELMQEVNYGRIEGLRVQNGHIMYWEGTPSIHGGGTPLSGANLLVNCPLLTGYSTSSNCATV